MPGKTHTYLSIFIFVIGSLIGLLAFLAPEIGLGRNEEFFFFKNYGWTRRHVFSNGAYLIALSMILYSFPFVVRTWVYLLKFVRRHIILERMSFSRISTSEAKKSYSPSVYIAAGGIVLFLSGFCSILAYEIYHRIELVDRLEERVNSSFLWVHSNSLHSDPERLNDYLNSHNEAPEDGQFRASADFHLSIAHESKGINNFTVKTNSHGLLSSNEYTVDRDSDNPEYRIAVLGDSFTGPTTSTYQWVDTIEEILNSSPEMKSAVQGKEFKVYNFGWIGGGFHTFWKEFDIGARKFDPDMVIVNYIEWDYPRSDGSHLSSVEDMVNHAETYMKKILDEHENVIVTLMPNYNDMIPNQHDAMSDYKRTTMLQAQYPKFQPILMKDLMPTYLGEKEILSWFNIPHDAHYSDRGGEIYARKISSLIAERITGKRLGFSSYKTRFSDIVMGENKPRLRPVKTNVSYLSESPERIRYLKDHVKAEMLKGRIFSFYPYSWNLLTGKGTDGIETSGTEVHSGTFIDVPYGPGEDETVKLNIVCLRNDEADTPTNPKWTLLNPECKHYFSIFARPKP